MIIIKRVRFCYELNGEYSDMITNHSFSAMLLPSDSNRQKVEEVSIKIDNCPKHYTTIDNFNNKKIYGTIVDEHKNFQIMVKGIVKTGLDICEEYTTDFDKYAIFKYNTDITRPFEKIKKYYHQLNLKQYDSNYEKAMQVMHSLFKTMEYEKGVTSIYSTVEEILTLKKGVCQDYAHVMICILRMENIPARYVTGMMIGEGASHAWVEVLCNGYWYGFDPTNDMLVNEDYIKIANGRDSRDCAVIRGIFYGNVKQSQYEKVIVEQI